MTVKRGPFISLVVGDEVAAIFRGLEKMVSISLVLPWLSVALHLLRDNPMPALLVGVQADTDREDLR
jgi:hypothetical protein